MGLGFLIAYAMNLFRASQVFAGILVTILLVAVVNVVLDRFERRYLAWAK